MNHRSQRGRLTIVMLGALVHSFAPWKHEHSEVSYGSIIYIIGQSVPTHCHRTAGWELGPVVSAAKEKWNSEVLEKITTTDKSNTTLLEML
jgi:hypothetical protein